MRRVHNGTQQVILRTFYSSSALCVAHKLLHPSTIKASEGVVLLLVEKCVNTWKRRNKRERENKKMLRTVGGAVVAAADGWFGKCRCTKRRLSRL